VALAERLGQLCHGHLLRARCFRRRLGFHRRFGGRGAPASSVRPRGLVHLSHAQFSMRFEQLPALLRQLQLQRAGRRSTAHSG
jgi:hypothetical protein